MIAEDILDINVDLESHDFNKPQKQEARNPTGDEIS